MIAPVAPPPTLTAYERHILSALEDGCYLAELNRRLYLVNDRLPCYKRLVPITTLTNLLAAAVVREAGPGVWHSERIVQDELLRSMESQNCPATTGRLPGLQRDGLWPIRVGLRNLQGDGV